PPDAPRAGEQNKQTQSAQQNENRPARQPERVKRQAAAFFYFADGHPGIFILVGNFQSEWTLRGGHNDGLPLIDEGWFKFGFATGGQLDQLDMDVFRVRPAAQLHVQFRQAGGQRLADELAGGGGSVGGETAPGAGEFPLWIFGRAAV